MNKVKKALIYYGCKEYKQSLTLEIKESDLWYKTKDNYLN